MYGELRQTTEEMADVIKFAELNAEGVRKILKKCEKKTKMAGFIYRGTTGEGLLRDFVRQRLRPDNTASRLDDLRLSPNIPRLWGELQAMFSSMREKEDQWLREGKITRHQVNELHGRTTEPIVDGEGHLIERKHTEELLLTFQRRAMRTARKAKFYSTLAGQAQIDYEAEPVGAADAFGLFLNHYNTFLYMANYYVVIPTANEYASALGMWATLSGLLLAMTPLSSLLSSVIYSLWSNRSFKQPLVFCTIILVLGNLLYALALPFGSPALLFLARLIVGLGGNRAVNRRYIADFVTIDQKTFQSAIFVAVGSLGMTVGPGSQTLLNMINFSVFGLPVNPLTAPGWIMAILWFIFFFMTWLAFTEPIRKYAKSRDNDLLEPLLAIEEGDETIEDGMPAASSSFRSLKDPTKSVMDPSGTVVCLWVYFVLKLVQEAFQTAAPLVTAHFFGWGDAAVGNMLAIIGLLVLPTNLAVGKLSQMIPDRVGQSISLFLLGLGSALTFELNSSSFTVVQYLIGGFTLFISAQVLEGVNMGLLSKVMPKVMSKGLFNSGFLSTEAGTFGRVVGNVMISIAGAVAGEASVNNLVAIPSVVLVGFSLVCSYVFWDRLVPVAERMKADDVMAPPSGLSQMDGWGDLRIHPIPQQRSIVRRDSAGSSLYRPHTRNSVASSYGNPQQGEKPSQESVE